ncbi:thiol oxidoreductase [Reichenbachiella carrageenanivorans]|uniref:Thiol oxidoreductase n=1 Tax=Reichenbachiella carrageenanivorans TaxID=2979869 RepID=A0ABY6CUP7_9BACT|nr:di-heme oxidoredictase family protein [Reichenbachiella carrageenanivorans]UXX77641.1 thiol oxidoreductase [Reichenbachiella carrageenanivorans]
MKKILLLGLMWGMLLQGCEELLPSAPASNEILDGPIEGLSAAQMHTFLAGDEAFSEVFVPESGLGPYFVTSSCVTCHPGDGKGHPSSGLTRFGKFTNGSFDHMLAQGGPQLQNHAIPGFEAETIPAEATGITVFLAPAVTGMGLLEAVPDADILAKADPNDLDSDGISGEPNYIIPPVFFKPKTHHLANAGRYIGRFGKKAGAIDLLMQTVGAYKQDMGITSDFDLEDPINFNDSEIAIGQVGDPEVSASTVNQVVFYLQTLKPPLRRKAEDSDVIEGEMLFEQIGCATCHLPTMTSGPHAVEALAYKTFHPYTDLLMHDMGTDLDDGYTEGTAITSEWKTPALWGLGLSKNAQGGLYFLMHDGRAGSIEEAIMMHGGEAAAAAEKFEALAQADRDFVVRFLESL